MVSLVGGVVLLGLGTLLFKPQEIPKYSRILGRFCGKSLKLVMEAKSSLAKSKDSEILHMKKEFDFMMSEVASVRGEIRKGLNLRSITNGIQSKSDMEQQFQQLNENIVQNNQISPQLNNTITNTQINTVNTMNETVQQFTHEIQNNNTVNNIPQTPVFNNVQTQGNIRSTLATGNSSTVGIGSNILLRNMGKSTPKQTTVITPSFSSAFAELQEMERQNILNDPELRYPDFDQSKWNTYDYEKNSTKLTNTYPDLKEAPFSVVEFGHTPMNGLYDETSVGIRTEVLGGGADLVSINVLESIVAENFPNKEEANKLFNNK